jgi:WD40 repeat protein
MLNLLLTALALAAPVPSPEPLWEAVPPAPMSTVEPAAVAHGGDVVVVAGMSGRVEAWDTATWTRRWEAGVSPRPARGVALLDGSTVVIGDDEGRVHLLDLRDGQIRQQLGPIAGWISDVAVSADGTSVAATTLDGALGLWRLPGAAPVHLPGFDVPRSPPPSDSFFDLPGPGGGGAPLQGEPSGDPATAARRLEAVTFLPDGDLLVAGDFRDGGALVWVDPDTGSRRTLAASEGAGPLHPRRFGHRLAIAPDATTVALAWWGGGLDLLDVATGQRRWGTRISARNWAGPVTFTYDGEGIIVASPEALVHLDAGTGRERAREEGRFNSDLDLAPSGTQLVLVRYPQARLRRLDPSGLTRQDPGPTRDAVVDHLAWSPDGRLLATGSSYSEGVVLRDAGTGAPTARLPWPCTGLGGIRFDRAGRYLLLSSCDYEVGVTVFRVADGKPLKGLSGLATNGEGWFTADGQHLLVLDAFAGMARAWTVPKGRQVPLGAVPERWHTPAGTEDRDVALAQWGYRSSLTTHWLNRGRPSGGVSDPPDASASFGGFTLDGQDAASLAEQQVYVYRDRRIRTHLDVGPYASAVAIAPDGSRVAVGYRDGRVRVYTTP